MKKGQPLSFKVYLNPQVRGRGERAALIQQALERLGFARAWPALADLLSVRGAHADEFVYLSMDLESTEDARIKVYFRHHAATLEHLEAVASIIPTVKPGEVSRFCTLLTDSTGPFLARPIITCFSLTNPHHAHPSAGTLYLPIGSYVKDDAQARERNRACLAHYGLDVETYDRILKELPARPLDAGVGMHVYTSLRIGIPKPRVTLYFGPEAYNTFPPRAPGALAAVPAVKPAAGICGLYETESAAAHPFFQRLAREPVSLERLWLLMTNIGEGIVKEFPRWLSHVIAKVPDDRIRCILAKQLHDELGEGNYERAHKPMFEQMLRQLEAWRWQGEPASLLAPGTRMRERLEEIISSENPYECVGSLMIFEIYGKQFDTRIGDEFRRQTQVDTRSLGWLNLHETLEVDHASEESPPWPCCYPTTTRSGPRGGARSGRLPHRTSSSMACTGTASPEPAGPSSTLRITHSSLRGGRRPRSAGGEYSKRAVGGTPGKAPGTPSARLPAGDVNDEEETRGHSRICWDINGSL